MRIGTPGIVYHVLNRANRRDTLFFDDHDFSEFERVLFEAKFRLDMPLLDYAIMRNHFHLVVRPKIAKQLSRFMHWLTTTQTQRWHSEHGTSGTGALYQGRFKALPVQTDGHFLAVVRYVQRNPVRAGLVTRVQDWRWSGAWRFANNCHSGFLDEWPVLRPVNWLELVNEGQSEGELWAIREAVTHSAPFGNEQWTRETATNLGIMHTLPVSQRVSRSKGDSRPLL
jgi:putative transposase